MKLLSTASCAKGIATLLPALFLFGCMTTKESQPVAPSSFDTPPISYMLGQDDLQKMANAELNVHFWIQQARRFYANKDYAKSLRAADEALELDPTNETARKLAMLSSVYVSKSHISTYHDNNLIDDEQRQLFKDSLSSITTLVNAPANQPSRRTGTSDSAE